MTKQHRLVVLFLWGISVPTSLLSQQSVVAQNSTSQEISSPSETAGTQSDTGSQAETNSTAPELPVSLLGSESIRESNGPNVGAADTSSPRATLKSFIDATNSVYSQLKTRHFIDRDDPAFTAAGDRILDCLDTSQLPAFAEEEYASEVAVCIKEIIDRLEFPDWEEVPNLEMIDEKGGFEQLSRWLIPETRLTISRVESGPRKHEYLFSTGTVERAPDYFQSIESLPYRTTGPDTSPGLYDWYVSSPGNTRVAQIVRRLPDSLRFGRTLGLANWKWPGLLIALLVAVLAMALLYKLQIKYAEKTYPKRVVLYCLTAILPLAAAFVPIYFSLFCKEYITIRGTPLYVISFCSIAVSIFACILLAFVICNRIAEVVISSPSINRNGLNAQLIRIASKLTSVVLTVVVFLVGGQYLGIPVATLLASAGVGGIALALGAQDTLKTLFGTVMLMADKPFRVGERIVFKGYDGVVEDIGLRSTRIRLLSSHLVTIPNDELARMDIENIGRRNYIRRVFDIHIPLDSPCEKLESAVAIIRDQLENHEGYKAEYPPRVFFFEFVPEAFTIRVMYWYHPAEYWAYVAYSEKLNFEIFRAFESQGIRFSLPQRMTGADANGVPAPLEFKSV